MLKKHLKRILPNQFVKKINNFKNWRNNKNTYDGNNVYCLICQSEFKIFEPFGLNKRTNAYCPNCGSLERHRLLYKYLKDKTNLFGYKKVRLLHFAPEKMFYNLFSIAQNIEYIPCDLSPELYDWEGATRIIEVDITNIPFNDDHFDVILCNHVLEHVENDTKAMSELYRVMKNDGWGVFQVPIDYTLKETFEDATIITPEDRERVFGQSDHVRIYGRDFKDRLERAGFEVNEDDYVKTFSDQDRFKYGFMEKELIYYCKKQK